MSESRTAWGWGLASIDEFGQTYGIRICNGDRFLQTSPDTDSIPWQMIFRTREA